MKQTIEADPLPLKQKEIILNREKLKIVDPAQLERGLANVRTHASVAISELEFAIKEGKAKRNNQIFKPAMDSAEEKIARAKELGIDVADFEERFRQHVEE